MVTGTNAGTLVHAAIDALELRTNELHAGAFWRLWGSFGDGGCFKSITAGTTATTRTGATTPARTGATATARTGTTATARTAAPTGPQPRLATAAATAGTGAIARTGTGKTLSGWTG